MSPSQREREYERRRYEKWRDRQAARQAAARRRRRALLVVAATVAVLAVVGGVTWLALGGDDEPEATATPTDAATAQTSPTDAATGTADAASPCPAPTVTPPAEPVQLDTAPDPSVAEGRTWTATIATSCGDVTVDLLGEQAPQAVASFVTLAQEDFFVGTPCHRLTTEGIHVLQCGDPTGTGTGGPGYTFGPVENAPADDVYPAGTLAMARVGGDAGSQGSQFFLVYEDSTIPSDSAGGYTVFGRVTDGLDVVRQVAEGGVEGGATDGSPAWPVSLEQVTVQ
ncbi:peptidylprolyl isomerase [Kineosporiaceae bacterium SCSIO 59966]|nr:peptidylprolyl isomerase [Kineosporiaceae bacterium SCSIO 59966]